MTGDDLGRRLRETPVPDEAEARERARAVVGASFERREPVRSRRPRALAVAIPVLLALGLAALTPPGQAVGEWMRDVVRPEPPRRPTAFHLPAPGRLLVSGSRGAWIVERDGSRRRLGAYRQATWSARGRFVAAVAGTDLVAVDRKGVERWTLSRPEPVADPRWAPSGYRVAYRAGRELRVVIGDGTADRRLAARVRPVAPAWRPGGRHVLAWVDRRGAVRVADVDTGEELRRFAPGKTGRGGAGPTGAGGHDAVRSAGGHIRELSWSAGGRRLLARSARGLRALDLPTGRGRAIPAPAGRTFAAAAFAPAGRARVATIDYDPRTRRSALRLDDRLLFAGSGRFTDLAWSPDGRWLLVAWEDADQWIFVRADRVARVASTPAVRGLFDPGRRARDAAFPRVEGWCCR